MADPMTKEEVLELAQLFGRLPPDPVDQVVAELRREQPGLYRFLDSFNHVFPDPGERDKVPGIAVTTGQILKRSADPPGLVTAEIVQRAYQAYEAALTGRSDCGCPLNWLV